MMNFTQRKKIENYFFLLPLLCTSTHLTPPWNKKMQKKSLKFREFSLANKQSKGRERVSLPICHLLELCTHSFDEYDDLGNSALNDLPF